MSKQIDFNPNKIDGFYPKCLKMPFLIFVAVMIILAFIALLCCGGGVADCCKTPTKAESTQDLKAHSHKKQKPKEPEKFDDIKMRGEAMSANISLSQPQEKPIYQVAQEKFLQYGKIIDGYKIKISVFFDKNSSFLGKKQQVTFANSITNNAKDAKIAIILGYGCDLGDKQYNYFLINKRIERVIKAIKNQYPNIEIFSSNEGQLHNENIDEKGREFERRVDIYFY